MKQQKLEDIMQFAMGKNITQLKNAENIVYTPDDFENDLHSRNQSRTASECIISMIKLKAAPISIETEKMYITSNFLKCSFDRNVLDPWYFCYQFNQSKEIEEQIARCQQGTTLSVKKLTIQSVGKLDMSIPDIDQQHIIGAIYRNAIIQRDLMIQQAENMMDMTMTILKKYEEN